MAFVAAADSLVDDTCAAAAAAAVRCRSSCVVSRPGGLGAGWNHGAFLEAEVPARSRSSLAGATGAECLRQGPSSRGGLEEAGRAGRKGAQVRAAAVDVPALEDRAALGHVDDAQSAVVEAVAEVGYGEQHELEHEQDEQDEREGEVRDLESRGAVKVDMGQAAREGESPLEVVRVVVGRHHEGRTPLTMTGESRDGVVCSHAAGPCLRVYMYMNTMR